MSMRRKATPFQAKLRGDSEIFLLRQGDVQAAYPEFRRSLETDPRRAGAAFSRCFRANPNIDEILDQVFPAIPSAYVDVIKETSDAKQLSIAELVWKRLLTLNPRLKIGDFEPSCGRFTSGGRERRGPACLAGRHRGHVFTSTAAEPGSVIWDPSFESGVNSSYFGWSFQRFNKGITIGYDWKEKVFR